jgi:hypothetical protein
MSRALAGLLALGMLLALTPAATAGSPGAFEALGLVRFDSGVRAPEFELSGLDGTRVGIPPRDSTATLLVFWWTW